MIITKRRIRTPINIANVYRNFRLYRGNNNLKIRNNRNNFFIQIAFFLSTCRGIPIGIYDDLNFYDEINIYILNPCSFLVGRVMITCPRLGAKNCVSDQNNP